MIGPRQLDRTARVHWDRAATALTLLFIVGAATSNWAMSNIGMYNGPSAPRTLPIGWGVEAPSGVVLIGLMLTIRDGLHERIRTRGMAAIIFIASVVSAVVAPPAIALASGATLAVAETADALVYQRLRRQGRLLAAAASNLVSSVVDSVLFLLVAFGVQAAIEGSWALTVGKLEASLVTLVIFALTTSLLRTPQRSISGDLVRS